ncbi:hypothetical protein Bbelb_316490 [Branchiostoma belcheri]|nr:hypothetical protein Bbelb_316490 [Branchiostoma belcheri]
MTWVGARCRQGYGLIKITTAGKGAGYACVDEMSSVLVQGAESREMRKQLNAMRDEINRLKGASVDGLKDELLQLAARPKSAFKPQRALGLLEVLATTARRQGHQEAEEFETILQQLRPLKDGMLFKDILLVLLEDVITHCYPLERISATAHVVKIEQFTFRVWTAIWTSSGQFVLRPEPESNIKPRRTAPLPHDRDPHGFAEKPIQSNRRKDQPGMPKARPRSFKFRQKDTPQPDLYARQKQREVNGWRNIHDQLLTTSVELAAPTSTRCAFCKQDQEEDMTIYRCQDCGPTRDGEQIVTLDANFGLVRKSSSGKSYEEHHHGNRLFAKDDEVQCFVEAYSDAIKPSEDCSNFQAGSRLRSKNKQKKLDVTGVFGAACRHEMPLAFLNMSHGERLGYPVYMIQKLLMLKEDSNVRLKVVYDIACVLQKHLSNPRNGEVEMLDKIELAVPAFHAYGHITSCQGREGVPHSLQRKGIDAVNMKLRAEEEKQMLEKEMKENLSFTIACVSKAKTRCRAPKTTVGQANTLRGPVSASLGGWHPDSLYQASGGFGRRLESVEIGQIER